MLRDDDAFPVAVSATMGHVQEDDLRLNANDDFDDVFGSAPSSPSFSPSNLEQPHDDIFTSLDDSSYDEGRARVGNLEVSDIPRLKEKHETEGYRDGVTAGKATVVQAGFDEGYGLGAVLGLRIGAVLGMLEGLTSAVSISAKTEGPDEIKLWAEEKDRLQNLLAEARNELKTESVFGKDWWGVDGLWTYEVPGESKEGAEVIFPDVASAHPLVKKWESVMADEVSRWGLDLKVMEGEDINDGGGRKARNSKEQPLETPAGEGMVMGTPKSALIW